jgi:hypothetical protein
VWTKPRPSVPIANRKVPAAIAGNFPLGLLGILRTNHVDSTPQMNQIAVNSSQLNLNPKTNWHTRTINQNISPTKIDIVLLPVLAFFAADGGLRDELLALFRWFAP